MKTKRDWKPIQSRVHACQIEYVTIGHPVPCYLKSNKLFLTLSNQYHSPEWDLNLGPKRLVRVAEYPLLTKLRQQHKLNEKQVIFNTYLLMTKM